MTEILNFLLDTWEQYVVTLNKLTIEIGGYSVGAFDFVFACAVVSMVIGAFVHGAKSK